MTPDTADLLLSLSPETFVLFFIVVLLRPLGLMYGFTLFSWGFSNGLMLRLAVSAPLGLVAFASSPNEVTALIEDSQLLRIVPLLAVEFFLGFGIGAMASAPFHALKYSGHTTDSYRGENNSGLKDPSGSELSTFAVLNFVTGALIFTHLGGLYLIIENLFVSYQFWTIGGQDFSFGPDAFRLAAELITRSLVFGLTLAAPLLFVFYSIDFALAVGGRLAPRLQIFENSFMIKNLLTMLALPVYAVFLLRVSEANMSYAYAAATTLGGFLE